MSKNPRGKAPDDFRMGGADYQRAGVMARKAKAAKKKAAQAAEEPKPAPLPSWMTGDKRDLPKRPPGKREP